MTQSTDENSYAEAVYGFAIQMLKNGKSQEEIRNALEQQGVRGDAAAAVSRNVFELRKRARQEAGSLNMSIGAAAVVIGGAITAITYELARGGGVYVVAWGAILFGVVQFFRGCFQKIF